ncbi:glutathione S-transferase family protein [Alginatibacterium sediminis]|uniref:Glutathione S-transferase family protein n=1 Tax=Alginatibacterium sediminis TaxID=2164068 RepID=A0A420E9P3_9ALTE|nr:glutathione S-transferase family protein [Alginatibacterium sediminis]RKF17393.1 glutathione S-transferase family protein [Alginatibacterium sediminis]
MTLKLFFAPGACSGVTLNALEELNLDYERQRIQIHKGEQKSESYLALNPFGKVPALLVDGELLTENGAILIYLNSLVPGSKLFPNVEDAYQLSCIYSDLFWLSGTVHPAVRQVCMPVHFTLEDTKGVVEKGRLTLDLALKIAEQRLEKSTWWYGEQWSIVDTYLHWCYTRAQRGGFALDAYPVLRAHQLLLEKAPSFLRRQQIEADAAQD